jgi:hypothetical protein
MHHHRWALLTFREGHNLSTLKGTIHGTGGTAYLHWVALLTYTGGHHLPTQGGTTYLNRGAPLTYTEGHNLPTQGDTTYLHRGAPLTYTGGHHLPSQGAPLIPTQGGTTYLHRGAPLTYTGGHQSSRSDKLPHPPRGVQGARVGEAGSVGATDKHSFTHVASQVNVAL